MDYIGQTGLALRERLRMLRGVYAEQMPYRDPHTVGPALWAQRQISNEEYEASTCPIEGDVRWRKAMEAVAIARYRQQHGRSPTFNFGRMPAGYRMSSGNNARLVAAGTRFRGGPCEDALDCHLPSLPPIAPLDGNLDSRDWCGHAWSEWTPVALAITEVPGRALGLYRVRARKASLLYIGGGLIGARLRTHLNHRACC